MRNTFIEILHPYTAESWLDELVEASKNGDDFIAYIGLLRQPELESLKFTSNPEINLCRTFPYINILNTRNETMTRWYPKNDACTTKGLNEFIEIELNVPVDCQVIYYNGDYLNGNKSLLNIMFSNGQKPNLEFQLACTRRP